MLFVEDYQSWTAKTALYPQAGTGSVMALTYAALGAAGEAGEIANNVKKLIRDADTHERRVKIAQELGDLCWYVARLATELEVDLGDVMKANQMKLEDRKERNVIKGDGDNR